jgi:uncharacterized protein YbjT (DUF2867 family)
VDEPRVVVRDGRAFVPRFAPAPPGEPFVVEAGRSYVVTGGTGALGRAVVAWLLERGAEHVVVAARREAEVDERASFVPADLSRAEDVDRVLAAARSRAPLGAVFHLAGTADGAGKLAGARHLDARLPDEPLIVVSSAIAWLGRPGAGPYGAANAAVEALISARVAAGKPGRALAFGPWSVGMGAGGGWEREGIGVFDASSGIAALERGLRCASPVVFLVEADRKALGSRYAVEPPWLEGWPGEPAPAVIPRAVDVAGVVRAEVAALLGRSVPDDQGLFEAGLDSLGAVELARRLSRALGRPLATTVAFEHPDVARLVRHLSPTEAPPVTVSTRGASTEPLAIVGLGCRFPGAADPDELWELLLSQRVATREVPADRWSLDAWYDPEPGKVGRMYARRGGFLEEPAGFDPEFFGISAREAASIDPQHRLLL